MRLLGFLLAALGLVALVHGGPGSNGQRTLIDIRPFKVTATEPTHIPIAPIVGGIALIGGVILLALPRKRPA